MKRPSFEELERIFIGALERGDETLEAYLQRSCAGRPELERRIRAMLDVHDRAADFIQAPATDVDGRPSILRPGERVGDCVVRRLIATGGMGAVYEAEQHHPQRRVALKLLSRPGSRRFARRFELEVEALGRLRHPGIAQVLGAGTVDVEGRPLPYYVMELVEGVSLADRLSESRFSKDERFDLLLQICDAIHHAHQRGVIHRDIKPSNVVVDDAGRARVVDFGIAKITAEDTDERLRTATRVGDHLCTLAYAAPEQVAERFGPTDVRTDVYALGIMACEILGGTRPYATDGPLETSLRSITSTTPDLSAVERAGFGADLCTVVRRALGKAPEQRYDTVAAFRDDLRRARRGEPIEARRGHPGYVLRKLLWRHRFAVGLGVGLFVLVGALALSSTVAWRKAEDSSSELLQELRRSRVDRIRLLARDGQASKATNEAWAALAELLRSESDTHLDSDLRDLFWAMRVAYREAPLLATLRYPGQGTITTAAKGAGDTDLLITDDAGHAWKLDVDTGVWIPGPKPFERTVHRLVRTTSGALVGVGLTDSSELQLRGWDGDFAEPRLVHALVPQNDARLSAVDATVYVATADSLVIVNTVSWQTEILDVPTRSIPHCIGPDELTLFCADRWELVRLDRRTGETTRWPFKKPDKRFLALSRDRQQVLIFILRTLATLPVDAAAGATPTVTTIADSNIAYGVLGDSGSLVMTDAPFSLLLRSREGTTTTLPLGEPGVAVVEYAELGRVAVALPSSVAVFETGSRGDLREYAGSGRTDWHSARIDAQGRVIAGGIDGRSATSLAKSSFRGRLGIFTDTAPPSLTTTREGAIAGLEVLRRGDVVAVGHDGRVTHLSGTERFVVFDEPGVELYTVAAARDEALVAFAGMTPTIRVVELGARREPITLRSSNQWVKSVAFDPQGTRLVAVGKGGQVEVWDIPSGERSLLMTSEEFVHNRAAAWSSDGRWVAVGDDLGVVRIADMSSDGQHHSIPAHSAQVFALDFSPTEPELLVSGAANGVVKLWDVSTGRELARLLETPRSESGEAAMVFDVAFAPDGNHVVVAGQRDTLNVIDLYYFDRHIADNFEARANAVGFEISDSPQWPPRVQRLLERRPARAPVATSLRSTRRSEVAPASR